MYEWQGKDRSGSVVKGELESVSETAIRATLRRQGINPTKVKKKPKEIVLFGGGDKVSAEELVIFTRQLATMINAGLPLIQGLELVAGGTPGKGMQNVLLSLKRDIEEGMTFSEALRKKPDVFDNLFVNLVAAGEKGGILDNILNRLAVYKEKAAKLKKKIKSAMFYPIAVIVVAFIVTAVLLIFVIPKFGEMFKDFGAALPAPTQFVMNLSDMMVEYWYVVFGAPVLLVFAVKAIVKTPKGRYKADKLMLNAPVLGDIIRKAAIARFSSTMSTMLAAGVPMLETLETVAVTSGNLILEEAIFKARAAISEGKTLTDPLRDTGVFPPMVIQMIQIGEQTGAIDSMLGKVADFYEEEVDTAVDGLTSLLEPLIMAFLGVVIGGLVVAMYLPVFQMGAIVGD